MKPLGWALAVVVVTCVMFAGWRVVRGPAGPPDRESATQRERANPEGTQRSPGELGASRDHANDAGDGFGESSRSDVDPGATSTPPTDDATQRLAELRAEIERLATARPVDDASLRRALERALGEGDDGVALVLDVAASGELAFAGRAAMIGELLRGVDDERIVPALRSVVEASIEGGDWREVTGYLDRLADEPERVADLFERLIDVRVGSIAVEAMRRLPRLEGSIDVAAILAGVTASTSRSDILLASLYEFESGAVRERVLETVFGETLPRAARTNAYAQIGKSVEPGELDAFVAPFPGAPEDTRAVILGALVGLAENPDLTASDRVSAGTPILIAALSDESRNLRREALSVIGRDHAYRGEAILDELAHLAATTSSTEERRTAELLLERVRSRASDD